MRRVAFVTAEGFQNHDPSLYFVPHVHIFSKVRNMTNNKLKFLVALVTLSKMWVWSMRTIAATILRRLSKG